MIVSPQGILCVPEGGSGEATQSLLFVHLPTHTTQCRLELHGGVTTRFPATPDATTAVSAPANWESVWSPSLGLTSNMVSFSAFGSTQTPAWKRVARRSAAAGGLQEKKGSPHHIDSDSDSESDSGEQKLHGEGWKAKAPKRYASGQHVAVVMPPSSATLQQRKAEDCEGAPFFSVLVVRRDTWAVQWGVQRLHCSPSRHYTPQAHLTSLLSSALLCGFAAPNDVPSTSSPSVVFYVSTQPCIARRPGSSSTACRAFISPAHVFSLSEIPTIIGSKALHHEETPLAITATSPTRCVVLFASGALFELRITVQLVKEKTTSSRAGGQEQEPVTVSVESRYLANCPVNGITAKDHQTPCVAMEVLRSHAVGSSTSQGEDPHEDREEEVAHLLAVYPTSSPDADAAASSSLPKARGDGSAEATGDTVHLLSLPSWPSVSATPGGSTSSQQETTPTPPPKCFSMNVDPKYVLRHAELVENVFAMQQQHQEQREKANTSSKAKRKPTNTSSGASSAILLRLQQRAAPYTTAVQCALLLPAHSDESKPFAAGVADVVALPPIVLPSPALKLISSYYDVSRQEHVLICGSHRRAQFFDQVCRFQSSSVSSSSLTSSSRSAEELLARYPESWIVARVPYAEEFGGYSPVNATLRPEHTTWLPLLRGGWYAVAESASVIIHEGENLRRSDDTMEAEAVAELVARGNLRRIVQREDGVREEEGDDAHPHSGSAPVKLFYALTHFASDEKKDPSSEGGMTADLGFFSVTVAAGLHNRLGKQWHNNARGLLVVIREALRRKATRAAQRNEEEEDGEGDKRLVAAERDAFHPLSLLFQHTWHPTSLRRVLKWLSAAQLGRLLQRSCEWIQLASECTSGRGVWYFQAATIATDWALQIISLAKQKGLSLQPFVAPRSAVTTPSRSEDAGKSRCTLEPLLLLLRSARAVGHSLRALVPRIEMVVEAGRQQRLLHSLLLANKHPTPSAEDAAWSGEMPQEAELERLRHVVESLHASSSTAQSVVSLEQGPRHSSAATALRYLPNAWTVPLEAGVSPLYAGRSPRIATITAEAAKYLQQAQEAESSMGESRRFEPCRLSPLLHHSNEEENAGASRETVEVKRAAQLVDWPTWGRQPHSDGVLRVFESALV